MPEPPTYAEVLWPDDQRGPWRVGLWWRVQYGVPTPVGLSMVSWVDDEERRVSGSHNALPGPEDAVELPRLDGRVLRALPVAQIADATRAHIQAVLNEPLTRDGVDEPALAGWISSTAEKRDAFNAGTRGRDLGDEHYREVAQVYAAARAGGRPTLAVAEHFTVSKSAAAKKVSRARQRGFLPATKRGRVGSITEEL